ncbi:Hypothetical predicted protein [Octopus vulgaris]|uniref:Reverse transcriptase domain-containing protein n=1 Tax=Octopus vulgaris TaxID=6645 RepID=A0AA36AMQ7_OCTVU|nr:Hypothetical predicted protein [Octopus vulgaris]
MLINRFQRQTLLVASSGILLYITVILSNIDHHITKKINHLVSKHYNSLTDNGRDYITNFEPKPSNFYGLPKIQKSEDIQQAVREQGSEYIQVLYPKDLKLRPIIAGPACPTHRLSNFDIILKSLCTYIPNFIRDDIDFLSHLPKTTEPNSILLSFDVVSLYTNIPHG